MLFWKENWQAEGERWDRVAVALIVESDKKIGLTDHNSNETIILKLRLNICPMAKLLRGRNACEREAPCLWNVCLIGHVRVPRTTTMSCHILSRSITKFTTSRYPDMDSFPTTTSWEVSRRAGPHVSVPTMTFNRRFPTLLSLFWKLDSKRLETISDIPNIYESTQ